MKMKQQPAQRSQKKNNKKDKNSSGVMRIFYVFMLVLMLSSSFIRIVGASRHQSATPVPQANPASDGETAARVFVFHQEDSKAGTCADLVTPAEGSAVYSDCGQGNEKQYDLSDAELAQLQDWISHFQPINIERSADSISTQLYLNGQGNQAASDTDIQSMLKFADTVIAKIISNSK
jgi:hypothetical protein